MAEVITTKPINLYQLGVEIGQPCSFRLVGPNADGAYRLRTESVIQQVLVAAVEAHVADPGVVSPDVAAAAAADADRVVKAARITPEKVAWLRQQAAAANATTATSGNAVAVLNAVLDNLAIFYDGFADLLEGHGFVRR